MRGSPNQNQGIGMALTDARLRAARRGDKLVKLSDSHGLQFWLYPSGARSWRLVYMFGGKQCSMTIGPYPEISLREARIAADDARRSVRGGIDPGPRGKASAAFANASAPTFGEVRALWVENEAKKLKCATTVTRNARFTKLAGELDDRPIRDIRAFEILKLLQKLADARKFETAKRVRATISSVFRFGIALDYVTADPAAHLKGMIATPRSRARAAAIDRKGFAELMRAISAYEGRGCTKDALMLLALTAARPGELRLAQWTEFDLEEAVWSIPSGRMKMRRAHRVPLARQSLAILKRLCDESKRAETPLVCPSARPGRPLSENAFNCALRSMGVEADVATAHGFRSSFSTLANESGLWRPETIEMALAHVDSTVRGIYQRSDMFSERARLAQWWADEIDAMISGRDKRVSKFEQQPDLAERFLNAVPMYGSAR